MSYTPTGDALSTAADVAKIGLSVVQDPALPEVYRLLTRVIDNAGGPSKPKDPSKPNAPRDLSKGIGLKHAVMPLRVVVKVQENPWVVPIAVGGTVALIFMLGVATGKARRRRP